MYLFKIVTSAWNSIIKLFLISPSCGPVFQHPSLLPSYSKQHYVRAIYKMYSASTASRMRRMGKGGRKFTSLCKWDFHAPCVCVKISIYLHLWTCLYKHCLIKVIIDIKYYQPPNNFNFYVDQIQNRRLSLWTCVLFQGVSRRMM